MESVPAAIVAVDAGGALAYWNPAAAEMLGARLVRGSPWRDALDPRHADETTPFPEAPLQRALGGEAAEADVFLAGAGRHVAMLARPCATGAVAVLHDIDARRRTERFLDAIIEHVPNMIFLKDAEELRLVLMNRAGVQLMGKPREELIGKSNHDLFPKDQADFFTARDRETLSGDLVVDTAEEPIETENGLRWLHTRKVPIRDEHGRASHLLGISLDITETKAIRDEEMRRAQRMEAVGRLAGGIAHDFNNMITAITAHAQLLLMERALPGRTRGGLQEILHAGERAAALTARLLAFSRREVSTASPADLESVVRDMQGMLQRLIREDIAMTIEAEHGLPPVAVDALELEQVVLNLVVNARDAMPNGGELRVEIARAGDRVRLRVTDSGEGMSEETKRRLFEPFFTTKPVGMGTGLGLSTTLEIVRQRGGDIEVTSELGRGARFDVMLPIAHGQKVARTVVPAGPGLESGVGTVLLVEDDELVRRALANVLETAGYNVLPASDAATALRVAATHPGTIDALVTDMVMPGMSGRALADAVTDKLGTVRVLFMSGYTEDAVARGAHFIAKPFTPDELTTKLRDLIAG